MTTCNQIAQHLSAYVDRELPSAEMDAIRTHADSCATCAAQVIALHDAKSAVRRAGNTYIASLKLRARISDLIREEQGIRLSRETSTSILPRTGLLRGWYGWSLATAACLIVASLLFIETNRWTQRQAVTEFADLHVSVLASTHPVEVVSTDRHTVKPWFQGKIPFTFELPELQGTSFTLVGGRVAYFHQEPAAHLIFRFQQHLISVFVLRETSQGGFGPASASSSSFNMRTWTKGTLRYVVIGDASGNAIEQLAQSLKNAD